MTSDQITEQVRRVLEQPAAVAATGVRPAGTFVGTILTTGLVGLRLQGSDGKSYYLAVLEADSFESADA